MKQHGPPLLVVLLSGIGANGCSSSNGHSSDDGSLPRVEVAPTSLSIVPGSDFHDGAGRRWECLGKVAFKNLDPDARFGNSAAGTPPTSLNTPSAPPTPDLGAQELAQKLKPVRLIGEYEYRLAEPDTLVANKIIELRKLPALPSTEPRPPVPSNAGVSVKPKWWWNPDDRSAWTATGFGASAFGHLSQNCTLTMIGPSTALSAAHCFYQNGAWISGGLVALGANNTGPANANFTTPFGVYYADSLTLPGEWVVGAGSSGGGGNTNESHPGWDWDFAVLEFSPTRYPGYSTGWFGTRVRFAGLQYHLGYPTDQNKLYRSQWIVQGEFFGTEGARYKHGIDIGPGSSGGCFYNGDWVESWYCSAIVSSGWEVGGIQWNEARAWDLTTYAFFQTYGNWP